MLATIALLLALGEFSTVSAQLVAQPINRPSEYWRCHEKDSVCRLVDVPIRIDGEALNECGKANIEWSNSTVAGPDSGVNWQLYANASTPAPSDNSGRVESFVEGQAFSTPEMEQSWTVSYSEGTRVSFTVEAYHDNVYYSGVSQELVVGAKSDGSSNCITQTHTPLVVTWPEEITDCGFATISWTGGHSGIALEASTQVGDMWNYHRLEYQKVSQSENSYIAVWSENYPVGASVHLNFVAEDPWRWYANRQFNVTKSPSRSCNIPQRNRGGGHWEGRKGALVVIILGSILGGCALGVAGGYTVYRWVVLPRREGAVQLE